VPPGARRKPPGAAAEARSRAWMSPFVKVLDDCAVAM
jgi:hypothetical protein